MLKQVEVVAAVLCHNGRVLATQRGYGPWAGWWEFPGGKVKAGETHSEALARELKEELDADIAIERFLTTVEYDYPDFHLIMHCYRCHLLRNTYTLKEHLAARWLDKSSLQEVRWLPADRDLIENLFDRYLS